VISDLPVAPGPWTPFIGGIIGVVFGVGGGTLRHFVKNRPNVLWFAVSAVALTIVSEFLQNWWASWFFGIPLLVSMLQGVQSLITALVNNTVLFTILAPKVISVIQEQM
jgi:hypothetical protein